MLDFRQIDPITLPQRKPIFSIVIPAYNEERFIEACLLSLKAQDFPGPVEIIVVDNNSTDRTSAIASKLGATVIFEPQRGVCAARQAGTAKAQGEIIISTDADTTFSPTWLSQIWQDFTTNPDAIAVAGSCEYVDSPWWARAYSRTMFGIVNAIYRGTGQVKYITASNTAFRKEAWTGYNVKLAQGGDEFGLLAQLKTKGRVVFQPNNLVFTSSRRLRQGLLYNLFVTILAYYVVDYLFGRLIGQSLFGSYTPIREDKPRVSRINFILQPIAIIFVATLMYSVAAHNARAARLIHKARSQIVTLGSKFDRDGQR